MPDTAGPVDDPAPPIGSRRPDPPPPKTVRRWTCRLRGSRVLSTPADRDRRAYPRGCSVPASSRHVQAG